MPFRAGYVEGQQPAHQQVLAAHAAARETGAPTGPTLLADISEFQPDIADAKYLAWSKAIVIRAAYGDAHDDRAWFGGDRRKQLHDGGVQFLGIYQYLAAGQDPAAQARELVRLVGSLRTGEKIICDIEEGAGNQAARRDAWKHVIADALGDSAWTYSGLSFAGAHGLAPADWVAAYQSAEPAPVHQLWQFTDRLAIPGIGTCDCSVFHGSAAQLAALAHGGKPVPVPQPGKNWTETLLESLPVLSLNASGEDVRTAQGLLTARGFSVAVDGKYGPSTRAAVTAFQHARSLAADGSVGPATWPKLANR
jgi:hypothetical protein